MSATWLNIDKTALFDVCFRTNVKRPSKATLPSHCFRCPSGTVSARDVEGLGSACLKALNPARLKSSLPSGYATFGSIRAQRSAEGGEGQIVVDIESKCNRINENVLFYGLYSRLTVLSLLHLLLWLGSLSQAFGDPPCLFLMNSQLFTLANGSA